MEQSLHSMPLFTITSRCSQEINNRYRGLPSDERFCLEIFRRALLEGDNDAWAALQKQFSENIVRWFRRHPKRWEALEIELEQNYVDETFSRLWQWGYNQKTRFNHLAGFNFQAGFDSLPGALRFLHDCLDSLIVDKLRKHARQQVVSMEEVDPPTPPTSEAHVLWQELWSKVRAILPDEREFRIIFLVYHEGLKPRQILQYCPGEFNDIKEVRRLLKNAMDRLRSHKAIFRLLLGYDDPGQ